MGPPKGPVFGELPCFHITGKRKTKPNEEVFPKPSKLSPEETLIKRQELYLNHSTGASKIQCMLHTYLKCRGSLNPLSEDNMRHMKEPLQDFLTTSFNVDGP